MFNFGGSSNKSKNNSAFDNSSDYQYGAEADPFSQQMGQDMWGAAMDQYMGGWGQASGTGMPFNRLEAGTQLAGNRLNRNYGQYQGGYNNAMGGGNFENPWNVGKNSMAWQNQENMQNRQGDIAYNDMRELNNRTGPSNTQMMYQDIVGGPGNEYIDPMVDALRGDYEDMFTESFLPSLETNAVSTGNLGSDRQGIAQAQGGAEMAKNFARDAINMRGQNYDTDMGWKMDIANMADANDQLNRDRAYNIWDATNRNQNTALDRQGGYGSASDESTRWAMGQGDQMNNMTQYGNQMWQNAAMMPFMPLQYLSQFQNQYNPNMFEFGTGSSSGSGTSSGSSKGGSIGFGVG